MIKSLKNHNGIFAGDKKVSKLISPNFTAISKFQTIYGISSVLTLRLIFCQYTSLVNLSTLAKNKYPDITKNAGTTTFTKV
jgi:hypothetical protein